ncbi:MAG: DUF302 domain-containing protein [Chthoniobacterales bacterium]
MRYIVESHKTPEAAVEDLRAAVAKHGFGVLHAYDLKETLTSKGFPLPHACYILEVCNPEQASKVLSADMGMNIALPCRISVYEEGGKTKIATALPTKLLAALSASPALTAVAEDVETKMKAMMHDAA